MDNRPIKAKNNESGTITALLTAAEVTSAHVSPVPENAPGILVMNPATTEEEHIFYRERDAVLGTISGLTRDIENQNGGVGREAQANASWETLQSTRYLNNIVDILIEGYSQETNDVAYVSAASFTVKTNRTTIYTKGRIVRFDDGAIAVVSADATYSAGTGLTTVLVTGTVPNPTVTVEIGIQHKGRTDIFASGSDINTGTDLYKTVTAKAIADSNIAFLSDIMAEASAAEINTGTIQNKYASPKSIADSNIAFLSDIPNTLANDGWTPASTTWTYNAVNKINVPSGAASIYRIGDCIRWKQGGAYKYGTLSAVADTLLTIIVNTDYVVDNAAITDNYYSHQPGPIGFPASFAFVPSWTNLTVGSGENIGTYRVNNRKISLSARFTFGVGSAVGSDAKYNFPVTLIGILGFFGVVSFVDATANILMGFLRNDGYLKFYSTVGTNQTFGYLTATSPFTWATSDQIYVELAADF